MTFIRVLYSVFIMALKRFDEGNEENEPTSRVWVSSNQSRHHQKSFRLSVSPFLFTRRQRNDTRRRLGACRGCLRCRRCSIRFPVQLVCVGSVSLKAGVGLTSASGFDDTLVRCRKSSIRKMLGMAGILDDFFWKGFFFPGWKKNAGDAKDSHHAMIRNLSLSCKSSGMLGILDEIPRDVCN